jgi:hypothetical protein
MSNPTPVTSDVTRHFRMADAGIFGDDGRAGRERVELIEGEILETPAPNPPHSSAVSERYRLLVEAMLRSRALEVPDTSSPSALPVCPIDWARVFT